MLSVVAELLGEQRAREGAPGERRIRRQLGQHGPHEDEVVGRAMKAFESPRELSAAVVGVEIGRERRHAAVLERKLAVRIAAGRHDQERAASCRRELVLVEADVPPGDVRQRRERLRGDACRQLLLDRLEPVPDGFCGDPPMSHDADIFTDGYDRVGRQSDTRG